VTNFLVDKSGVMRSVSSDPSMPVDKQQQAILVYSQWVKENGENYKPGAWYLFGKPQLVNG